MLGPTSQYLPSCQWNNNNIDIIMMMMMYCNEKDMIGGHEQNTAISSGNTINGIKETRE